MKKLLLVLSLLMVGLSGCYVVPNRGHDDGYRGDRDHRDDKNHDRGRDGDRRDRDGYR